MCLFLLGTEQPQRLHLLLRKIYAPVSGVLYVQEVHDEVISSGLFGQGYGICLSWS